MMDKLGFLREETNKAFYNPNVNKERGLLSDIY